MATESRAGQLCQRLLLRIGGPAEGWIRASVLGGTATALTLAGSFLKFLNYNDYPVASSEAMLVFAGILVLSTAVGLCCGTWRGFTRIVIPAILAYLAIDLHFNNSWLPVIGVLAAAVFSRFSRQALILLFGVVIVSETSIAAVGASPAADEAPVRAASTVPAKSQLAIVHLILDEHIGLEGIPDSVPRGAEVRERLRRFYLDHGFRIFGGAYSEGLHTVNAVPRALNVENPNPWNKGDKRNGITLERNAYFDSLQSMGMQIDVIQSDWIDYCGHIAVEKCKTYFAGGLIDVGDKLPTTDKAAILIYRFAALTGLVRNMLQVYDILALAARRAGFDVQPVELRTRLFTSSLQAMAVFEDAIEAARSLVPGKAIFAHVLLPHHPYVYDPACGVRRVSDWLGAGSAVPWERRYTAYFDQLICTISKVEALLAAVASSPAAGKTVFIIHGDHGSRIVRTEPRIENEGKFSSRDLVDAHAAFFAVAIPGIEPGYDTGRYPLRVLLDALVRSQFRTLEPTLPADFVPTIMLEDREWNPTAERPVGEVEWWNTQSGRPAL
jgi:hypothetical protein